jgi:hypothetical protein
MKRLTALIAIVAILNFCTPFQAYATPGVAFGGCDAGRTSVSAASASWSGPTVSGSNTYGVVMVNAFTDSITSVTWNGVAMQQATKVSFSGSGPVGKTGYAYVLAGVTTGTIQVSASASVSIDAFACYYTGAQTTTTPDAVQAVEETASGARTLTFANHASSWLVASHASASANPTGISGGTERAPDNHDDDFIDSNAAAAANSSIGWTWGVSDHHIMVGVAIAPTASAVVTPSSFGIFNITWW